MMREPGDGGGVIAFLFGVVLKGDNPLSDDHGAAHRQA